MNSNPIEKFLEGLFNECPIGNCTQENEIQERAIETTDSFIVELELAGVKKEDIELDIDADYLKVTATKKAPSVDEARVLFSNRTSGKFDKSYKLGSNIDQDTIVAEFTDGVLKITLDKKEDKKKKTVKIS